MDEDDVYNLTAFFLSENLPKLLVYYNRNPDQMLQDKFRRSKDLHESLFQTIPKLQDEVNERRKKIQQTKSEINTLHEKIVNQPKDIQKMEKELSKAEKAVQRSRVPVSHYESRCSLREKMLKKAKKLLEDEKFKLAEMEKAYDKSEMDSEQLKTQESKCSTLRSQYMSRLSEYRNSRTLYLAAKKQLLDDEQRRDKCKAQLSTYKAETVTMQEEKSKLEAELKQMTHLIHHSGMLLKNQISLAASHEKFLLTIEFVENLKISQHENQFC